MKQEIYDKNYSNTQLTIPSHIWNNKQIYGVAKIMMALYEKMTKNGREPIKNMTIRQAQIINTRKQDIEYNQAKLISSGFIEVYTDVVMGEMLVYNYRSIQSSPEVIEMNGPQSLF